MLQRPGGRFVTYKVSILSQHQLTTCFQQCYSFKKLNITKPIEDPKIWIPTWKNTLFIAFFARKKFAVKIRQA